MSAAAPDNEIAEHACDVAPYALLRIAALPYGVLNSLRPGDTCDFLERASLEFAQVDPGCAGAERTLYDLVPRLDNRRQLRRSVLALQRDIHNRRSTSVSAQDISEILALIAAPAAESLRHCLEGLARYHEALCAADAAYEREHEKLLVHLQDVATTPHIAEAMALASPVLTRSMLSGPKLDAKSRHSKLHRSLFGYISRAAAKTSPFSTFMFQTPMWVDFGAAEEPLEMEKLPYVKRARVNRGVVDAIFRALSQQLARTGNIPIARNPTIADLGSGRISALCDQAIVMGGRSWRQQRRAIIRLHPMVVSALLAQPQTAYWDEWHACMRAAGLTAEQSQRLIAQLLDRGVLVTAPITDGHDDDPLDSLLQWLGDFDNPICRAVRSEVAEMAECVRQFAGAGVRTRLQHLIQFSAKRDEILRSIGREPEQVEQNLVFEDSYLTDTAPTAGRSFSGALADLSSFLSTQVVISNDYRRLVKYFIDEFGSAGTCTDVVGFIGKVGDRLVDIAEFGAPAPHNEVIDAPRGAPIGVTIHAQVVPSDESASTLVINRVYTGAGWLAARFSAGEGPTYAALATRMRQWLEHVHAGAEPVDVLLNGHCNQLQAHPRLTKRTLVWPGEPLKAHRNEVIQAAELTMRLDERRGELQFFDSQQRRIAPVYLGTALPTFQWGILYATAILSQPYALARPSFTPELPGEDVDVHFVPRHTHGRAILRRASWWIRSRYLLSEWFRHDGARMLLDIQRSCEHLAIPGVFFAERRMDAKMNRTFITPESFDVDRKPFWVDVSNRLSLYPLEDLARKYEWVGLTEMLPAPHQLAVSGENGKHVSELHVELLVRST